MTQPIGACLGMEEKEKEKKKKEKEENGITLTNPSWGCVNKFYSRFPQCY